MVDSGPPGKKDLFLKYLKKASVNPRDIKLLIFTHGHWDHIGSAGALKDATAARTAIHEREKDWLEKALKPLPPGTTLHGRIFIKMTRKFMHRVDFPPVKADIVLKDEPFSLEQFGVPGKVVSTPGHSPGSVSVVLETGEAFVGDLAMSAFPMRLKPGLPIFAEDMQMVRDSWKKLLNMGVSVVYPAHGRPFPAERIRKFL